MCFYCGFKIYNVDDLGSRVLWELSCCFQSSVISLSKLLVREKGDTRDSKGIYLICQSKTEPEMYELVCRSPDDRKAWVKTVRDAVHRCPEEGKEALCSGEHWGCISLLLPRLVVLLSMLAMFSVLLVE